ncbi:Similar to Transcription initiation factor IIB; acc. no. Q58192 [Pyronema omphalodes CBS 100304]|uniref:Similar to Transcription initiation factor IIB acc. no. Q58192 n=1 Tax=Pyronema omphalodes (strain CBS 100304) TaxID=1076935 RepID=U4L1D3_PYROM|nr:Similar to Transcription initiation factor IIB; acc. no. Q58192 [Pyronema omphalodes CBS 100304]
MAPASTPGWKPIIGLTSTPDSSTPSSSATNSSANSPESSISPPSTPTKRSRRPLHALELAGLTPSDYKRLQDFQALLKPITSSLSPLIQSTTLNLLYKALSQRWFASVSYSVNKLQVACALIFEACKRCGEPHDMKEIARLVGLDSGQNFRKYVSLMNRKLVTLGAFEGTSAATMAWDLLPRYAERLGVPQVAKAAIGVAKAVGGEMVLGSRAANNVAASCLYVACILGGYPRGLRQLAEEAAEVTKGTIKKSVKLIHAKEKVLTANAFWPGDLNVAFWDMMIDPRYFHCTAKSLPKKKAEFIEESESEYEGNCNPNSSEKMKVCVGHAVDSPRYTENRF